MVKPRLKSIKYILAASLLSAGLPITSYGAGYQMRYQSAETMGTGFASDVTGAKTASGFFNNPSIIAFMDEGKHFSAEFTTLIPSGSFEGETTYGNSSSISDTEADGFGKVSILPSLYYGQKVADKLFVTATFSVPWATNSEYDNDWIGRYQATQTYLATFNLTPALTYAFNEKLAISGGVQVQYAVGELGTMVDVGGIGQGGGGTPANDDAEVVFDGDNLGFGAALSALYKHSDALRLGFQYRSQIKHNLKGEQSSRGTTPFSTGFIASPTGVGAGLGDGQSVEAEIVIPDNITLGASYMYNEKFDLHASLSWTGWSSFDSLVVENTDSGTSSESNLEWKDTYFLAAGADYYLNEKLILRGGLSYETGAPPDNRRTPRGVDDDRLGLNVGASFQFSEMLAFHGAFTQLIFLDKPTIDLNDPPQGIPQQGDLTGEFSTSASLFRLAVSAKF